MSRSQKLGRYQQTTPRWRGGCLPGAPCEPCPAPAPRRPFMVGQFLSRQSPRLTLPPPWPRCPSGEAPTPWCGPSKTPPPVPRHLFSLTTGSRAPSLPTHHPRAPARCFSHKYSFKLCAQCGCAGPGRPWMPPHQSLCASAARHPPPIMASPPPHPPPPPVACADNLTPCLQHQQLHARVHSPGTRAHPSTPALHPTCTAGNGAGT